MAGRWRRKLQWVVIDIDTQVDLIPALNGPGTAALRRNIRRLIAWARLNHIPVISTALTHRVEDFSGTDSEPPFCIEGTRGHRKIHYTLLPNHLFFGPSKSTDLPRNLFRDYQQIIFEKRTDDTFAHPRADRLLTEFTADEFVVFGTGLETGLRATVLGLLSRRKPVAVVTDAICMGDDNASRLTLRKFKAKGAKLVTTADLAGQRRHRENAFARIIAHKHT